jgi:hypothetical protein
MIRLFQMFSIEWYYFLKIRFCLKWDFSRSQSSKRTTFLQFAILTLEKWRMFPEKNFTLAFQRQHNECDSQHSKLLVLERKWCIHKNDVFHYPRPFSSVWNLNNKTRFEKSIVNKINLRKQRRRKSDGDWTWDCQIREECIEIR